MTIEELKQALKAATPGPLLIEYYDDFEDRIEITCEARKGKVAVAEIALGFKDSFDAQQKANARLIVEAINNLPKLLKVVEAVDIGCLERAGRWMSAAVEDPMVDAVCADNFAAALEQIAALRKAIEELNNGK